MGFVGFGLSGWAGLGVRMGKVRVGQGMSGWDGSGRVMSRWGQSGVGHDGVGQGRVGQDGGWPPSLLVSKCDIGTFVHKNH